MVMTEVALAFTHSHRLTGGIPNMLTARMANRVPAIEMRENPDFCFPILSPSITSPDDSGTKSRQATRPSSAGINQSSQSRPHRRAVSTLPTFSFNASDASGRAEEETTPPRTPQEDSLSLTPSRRGHRRGASEFVGGDSRFGVAEAISTSPPKMTTLPLPLPSPISGTAPGRRGHAHRRSTAMSSHDVTSIMQPSDAPTRLSSSLPSTPAEIPGRPLPAGSNIGVHSHTALPDPFGPPLEEVATFPQTRPRVGFSDDVEYIPRPLSTISSGTEESLSTLRGHSVNNSISSVLSLSTPSPPSTRVLNLPLTTTFEDDSPAKARSSIELNRRPHSENQVQRVKSSSSVVSTGRPKSEHSQSSPTVSFLDPDSPVLGGVRENTHKRARSIGHALGFDRRKSEPLISQKSADSSRLSAISLPGPAIEEDVPRRSDGFGQDRRSSTKRLKAWAFSKMGRKGKQAPADGEFAVVETVAPVGPNLYGVAAAQVDQDSVEVETNLDAVLDTPADEEETSLKAPPQFRTMQFHAQPDTLAIGSFQHDAGDDSGPVLDLDAALGPFKTPAFGFQRHRRELHSSRLTRDFSGPGGHYHRRAESAPALAPFESPVRSQNPGLMADVFEEDEEESLEQDGSDLEDEGGTGISVVDSDGSSSLGSTMNWGLENDDRPRRGDGDIERRAAQLVSTSSRLSTPIGERRAPSIIEETIIEEAGPAEAVQIVESHEEPRATSIPKSSSDSSETPTLLAGQVEYSVHGNRSGPLLTPETYQTSTFSSPDFHRRQGSFETSRLGTSTSSIADNRTMSSHTTGEAWIDQRVSVDDIPSLTSSRSTMMSSAFVQGGRVEAGGERVVRNSAASISPEVSAERRRKRASIQSLSQLVGGSFGPKSKTMDNGRPQTALETGPAMFGQKKKEHRLKKLMFWRNMSKQSLVSTQSQR